MNQHPQFQFQILTTADGSPTVRLWKEGQAAECMHHLGGALSESLYIYDSALQYSFHNHPSVHVLSVGLGLGYNELLSIARAKQHPDKKFYLESFESETWLRDAFLFWLQDESAPQYQDWFQIFDQVTAAVASHHQLLPAVLKFDLLELRKSGRWLLREKLDSETIFSKRFSCVLFDAFSKGATPDLWSEDFLKSFLKQATEPSCVLTTYAATGALKRALKENQFEVEMKPGFAGKRQSTWATRSR